MKAPPFVRMLAERAAQLAFLLALGFLAVGAVIWWNTYRATAGDTAAFIASLTNPPPPTMRTPDFSSQEAALAAGTQTVRAVLTGAHDLFAPSRPATVAGGDSR